MHRQANEVLPALLEVLAIDIGARPIWLFGHSDGASIALLYAARFPQGVSGCIVLAPHVMVEDVTVASIADARAAYLESDLRQRLARYHEDPDSAFWGWSQIWLQPSFRNWSITTEIKAIRCPLMAIQGLDDEYGSMAQIEGIVDKVAQTEVLALKVCGHAPHRDQPGLVVAAVSDFFQRHQSQLRGSTAVGVKPNSARNHL